MIRKKKRSEAKTMSYIESGKEKKQLYLDAECLDDYVDKNNPVRAIDAFVDILDIEKLGVTDHKSKDGRPGYDPRLMIKLYIYGYN